ncbi:Hypothetical protein RG1141_CH16590 [Neorhizobium galegae bv. officinalis bv. officinalis str. HAMBI 1141]|uniref:Uncharacterized protein n=1 Tax=Neorhizobium galegae bv. officinalis bv. officinalis str. HAMBI 1141 TaxID=1028801 RepID=A0A068T653_NEOGA|nr:hypothetical protein [Neorhizobium galegae]CDN54002.1 Hypothetical protein RG1141_CH16590 [Neorhizobium galegae bv. officinalis bv. officinalis str. HAMBI 1141]
MPELPIPLRGLLTIPLLFLPAAALAGDPAVCAALYRKLGNSPEIIGNTSAARSYAQQLGEYNADIRELRVDMRRAGCGNGSVVVLGGPNAEVCGQMRDALDRMEQSRDTLTAERNGSRQMILPSEERNAILAAIREQRCIPSFEPLPPVVDDKRKVPGIELPRQEEPYSGITNLRTHPPQKPQATAVPPPVLTPPPERPYDPSKKVRTVGPTFLPEAGIDLTNPKSAGPQPQQ